LRKNLVQMKLEQAAKSKSPPHQIRRLGHDGLLAIATGFASLGIG
jgi:hypothetical protein